jgi:signal transduction histidine kinase
MNKSRLVHLGFALVVVMLLADAALVYRASLRIVANDRRVAHTHAVLTQLEATLSTAQDAETGQRGYLLTGRDEYLEPYHKALTRLGDALERLDSLTADNPGQQGRTAAVRKELGAKVDELEETVRLRRERGPDAALAVVQAGHGRAIMEKVRQLIAAMEREEHRLLAGRRADSEAALVGMDRTLAITTAFAVLLVGALYVQQRRLEAELRRRAEQLAEADRRKDEFLAMLGHELRNPLAAIRSTVQLSRRPAMEGLIPENLELIEHEAGLLTRLIDDLLDIARITQGKVRLQKRPIELSEVVARACAAVRPHLDEKGHELSVALASGPLRLEADPARVEQIVVNLLTNAAKYTDGAGPIGLAARAEGGDIVITVCDAGIGIPAEMLPRIFDAFTQVDHPAGRSRGGLGLGLTLVRRFAELHGGSVSVASAGPGLGSEFTVRLPTGGTQPGDASSE